MRNNCAMIFNKLIPLLSKIQRMLSRRNRTFLKTIVKTSLYGAEVRSDGAQTKQIVYLVSLDWMNRPSRDITDKGGPRCYAGGPWQAPKPLLQLKTSGFTIKKMLLVHKKRNTRSFFIRN